MHKRYLICILAVLAMVTSALGISACTTPPQQATGGAKQITTLGFTIPRNSRGNTVEQQSILDRLAVTTDPTKVMWIHLISLDGKIIQRMPVANKVTSSGKRLEPKSAAETSNGFPSFLSANGFTYATDEFIQADGTFGESDPYIYWFDPQHRYHQWGTAGGLGYLLTDYPIDLRNPQDLVSGMFNADKAAFEWQKLQEQILCKKEGKTYDLQKGVCQ